MTRNLVLRSPGGADALRSEAPVTDKTWVVDLPVTLNAEEKRLRAANEGLRSPPLFPSLVCFSPLCGRCRQPGGQAFHVSHGALIVWRTWPPGRSTSRRRGLLRYPQSIWRFRHTYVLN
jgi:hypothetical protein